MIEVFIAIATLCGDPNAYSASPDKVLQCQKYYVKCTVATKGRSYSLKLAKCILDKDGTGGSK